MIFLVLSGKVVFFPENMVFFPGTDDLPKKYMETWYFLFDMFHAPLRKKNKLTTTLSRKNTPEGD